MLNNCFETSLIKQYSQDKKEEHLRLRIDATCNETFAEMFALGNRTNDKGWNTLMWELMYVTVDIESFNRRKPAETIFSNNDFSYEFQLITEKMLQLDFTFNEILKEFSAVDLNVTVYKKINQTHYYDHQKSYPFEKVRINKLIDSYTNIFYYLGAAIAWIVIFSGWGLGVLSIIFIKYKFEGCINWLYMAVLVISMSKVCLIYKTALSVDVLEILAVLGGISHFDILSEAYKKFIGIDNFND